MEKKSSVSVHSVCHVLPSLQETGQLSLSWLSLPKVLPSQLWLSTLLSLSCVSHLCLKIETMFLEGKIYIALSDVKWRTVKIAMVFLEDFSPSDDKQCYWKTTLRVLPKQSGTKYRKRQNLWSFGLLIWMKIDVKMCRVALSDLVECCIDMVVIWNTRDKDTINIVFAETVH